MTNDTKKSKKKSDQEQEEQAGALYDYIYRDTNRLNSYYAQLLGGRLATSEQTLTAQESEEKAYKGNFKVAEVDTRTSKQNLESTKSILDPHDLAVNDVLNTLLESGYLDGDLVNAPDGKLVIVEGCLSFIDKTILQFADMGFGMVIETEKAKPRKLVDDSAIKLWQTLQKIASKLELPSSFLLQTQDGSQVCGTIKDSGLEEPIYSYYFKHGFNGLPKVCVIGIKEEAISPSMNISGTPLLVAGKQIAQALSNVLFPPAAKRLTPLAMFRKITK